MTITAKKLNSLATILMLCCLVFLLTVPTAQAAKSDTLSIEVKIENYDSFWESHYFTKDLSPAKPAFVKLEWSIGDSNKTAATVLIKKNEPEGTYRIPANLGDVVNLRVYAADAKGKPIAAWNMQVLNSGQKETLTIIAPNEFIPDFNRS